MPPRRLASALSCSSPHFPVIKGKQRGEQIHTFISDPTGSYGYSNKRILPVRCCDPISLFSHLLKTNVN